MAYKGTDAATVAKIRAIAEARGVRTLKDLEEEAIAHAMNVFESSVTKAAIALGMGRATLYRRLAVMAEEHVEHVLRRSADEEVSAM